MQFFDKTYLWRHQEIARLLIDNTLLTKKEQLVLRHRYGLEGNPQTQVQIAKKMKVTKQRIQQIETAALKKLDIK